MLTKYVSIVFISTYCTCTFVILYTFMYFNVSNYPNIKGSAKSQKVLYTFNGVTVNTLTHLYD